jgi:hypothetical protein
MTNITNDLVPRYSKTDFNSVGIRLEELGLLIH